MGLTDKLKGIKKDDVDNINSQAGKYAGGKDGQTGTDLAQDKYKQYKAGKTADSAKDSLTGQNQGASSGTSGYGAGAGAGTGSGAGAVVE